MVERRKLTREEPAPVASSARSRRDDDGDVDSRDVRDDRDLPRRDRRSGPLGSGRRWTRGRPPLQAEFDDLGRGSAFVGIESAAIALDTAARVLRGVIDRAFDEDYERPGDMIRGVANEADLAAYDLATELRGVPRRLSRRFDDSLRSPRADRGERDRRSEDNGGGDERRAGVRARLRRNDD